MKNTELAVAGGQGVTPAEDPAILALLQSEMKIALEGIDPRPPRIKISREAPVFILEDGSTTKTLTGVIIYHHKARGYWANRDSKAPTCSSLDGRTGNFAILNDNGEIEETRTYACQACKFNQYGTAVGQDGKPGRGKACKEMRWIYFLGQISPGKYEIICSQINASPTSIKPFDTFITALVQKRIAPIQKVLRISLEAAEGSGFKYYVLAQPEILGDVDLSIISTLIGMRNSAVTAAQKAGVSQDDVIEVDGEVIASYSEPQGDEPF